MYILSAMYSLKRIIQISLCLFMTYLYQVIFLWRIISSIREGCSVLRWDGNGVEGYCLQQASTLSVGR